MKNWKKTSLLTAFIILVLLTGSYYVFNITVSIPSSDIKFSPGQAINKVKPEYFGEKPKNIIGNTLSKIEMPHNIPIFK